MKKVVYVWCPRVYKAQHTMTSPGPLTQPTVLLGEAAAIEQSWWP